MELFRSTMRPSGYDAIPVQDGASAALPLRNRSSLKGYTAVIFFTIAAVTTLLLGLHVATGHVNIHEALQSLSPFTSGYAAHMRADQALLSHPSSVATEAHAGFPSGYANPRPIHADAGVSSLGDAPYAISSYTEECVVSSICFAVDQSWSIYWQYGMQIKFIVDVATALKREAPDLEFSAVGFAWGAVVMQSSTASLDNFTTTVQTHHAQFGNTNLHAGLSTCYEQIKDKPGTGIIMLLTDGYPTAGGNPVPLADTINGMGPDKIIMTVGLGGGYSADQLKAIAKEDKFFFPIGFTDLPKLVSGIVDEVCTPFFTCTDAFEQCDFRFEGTSGVPTFAIDVQPDKAFTPAIVSTVPGEVLGQLNSNNIPPEFIVDKGVVAPINDFGTPQKLTPSQFKPLSIGGKKGTGIGHQTFHGDQLEVSKDKCIRIYFTSYQLFDPDTGYVKDNKNNVDKSMNKCVVFRTM